MKEITDAEREHVLAEIGMRTIRHAVSEGGMLIVDNLSITINKEAAETWAKRNARDYGVEAEVLHAVIVTHLKECAKKAIEEYM